MLKFLLEKEIKQLRRNKFLPRFVIALPFMALLVLPLAANFEVKNINLSIVDNDRSDYSKRLIHKIVSSGYFRLTNYSSTYKEALRAVELDYADIILEIPNNFETDLVNGKAARVMGSANTVNGTKGGLGSSYLLNTINDFSSDIRIEWLSQSENTQIPSISILPVYRYNPLLRYPVFMVPAIMVMMMTMICGFLPALNIVSEKENGTIEQINVTPVKRFTFILAKLIPYWVIGFVVLTVCFGVALFVYGLVPKGNILTIYLFASIFVLAFSGLGLTISNFATTVQQAMFLMFFFVMTFIFLSGLYTPVANMPDWAQTISVFSPLKYFIQVMRSVYLKGSGFRELTVQFYALCCFAIFFNMLAVFTYRKSV